MKLAIIGATGKAGQLLTKEALQQHLDVTAIVRNARKLTVELAVIEKEISALTAADLQGFDVVINAFGAAPGHEEEHVANGRHLIALLEGSATRLIVVGGAGSLFVDEAETVKLAETSEFPEIYLPTALNQAKNLEDLQASSINWTFVSPSAFFDAEGPRTGSYLIGGNKLLTNDAGESYVSYADFAIAVIDEVKNRAHLQQRFTVASNK